MSHEIEYKRFCIRTPAGFTPIWLHGSNNCTESMYCVDGRYHERLERHWSFWCEQVCVSPEELLAYAETFRGSAYGEHWKRAGKWIDDEGVVQWVKSAMKNAVPLEDFLRINRKSSIHLFIRYWDENDRQNEMHSCWAHTAKEFDQWATEAKKIKADEKSKGHDAFLCVSLGSREEIIVPPQREGPEKVVIKSFDRYVSEMADKQYAMSKKPEEAKIFERQEALEILFTHWSEEIRLAKLVDAKGEKHEKKAAIRVKNVGYLCERYRKRITVCSKLEDAKKYETLSQAQRDCKSLKTKYSKYDFEVFEIE